MIHKTQDTQHTRSKQTKQQQKTTTIQANSALRTLTQTTRQFFSNDNEPKGIDQHGKDEV